VKSKGLKALVVTGIIILTAFLVYQAFGEMLPQLFKVLKSGNEKEIADYLENVSTWRGLLCTVLLQFIQVISIVLPGMPIQIAAGMVYGVWRAFVLTYFGYVSANVTVFLVARHVGSEIVDKLPVKAKDNRLMKRINTVRPEFVVAMACLMPGVPNGIVPYIAANTKISVRNFMAAVAAGSGVPILLSCLTGHFLLTGDYVFSVLSIVILWILIITAFKKQDWILWKLDKIKNNQTKRNAH